MKKAKQSLTKLAEAAFRKAARRVIQRAFETGTPVIIWEDGAVKKVKANDGRFKQFSSRTKAERK